MQQRNKGDAAVRTTEDSVIAFAGVYVCVRGAFFCFLSDKCAGENHPCLQPADQFIFPDVNVNLTWDT